MSHSYYYSIRNNPCFHFLLHPNVSSASFPPGLFSESFSFLNAYIHTPPPHTPPLPTRTSSSTFLRAFNGECFYPPPPIPFGLSVIQFGNLQTEILQRLWAHCHQFLFSSTDGGKTLHVSTISPPCLPLIQPSLFPPPLLFWFPRTPPSSGFPRTLHLLLSTFLHSASNSSSPDPDCVDLKHSRPMLQPDSSINPGRC